MRKGKMINGDIIEIISKMGHTYEIVIADALLETYEYESYILKSGVIF